MTYLYISYMTCWMPVQIEDGKTKQEKVDEMDVYV